MKKLLLLLSAVLILQFQSANAQGTIQGTVIDETSKEILIGANVLVVGTALGGVTDVEGQYRIPRVPEGKATIRISYLGYKTKIADAAVVNGRTVVLNASLLPDVIEGSEVVITAQRRGQNAAINQQITSNTIVNVISKEKIKDLPDANAAEAIGRLPGVSLIRSGGEASKVILRGLSDKFTSITIDGVRIPATDANSRGVDMSTLSQGSLAGIELFKALTSDKDADAIAGSVNLVTRKAPSERELQVDAKGDYNQLMNSLKQYDLGLRYGERFFEDFFGIQVNGNFEQKIRSNERTSTQFQTLYKNSLPTAYNIANFRLQFIDEVRKRNGGGIIFDIITPDSGTIKFSNNYYQTSRNFTTYLRNYPSKDAGSTQVTYETRVREQEIGTLNSSIMGQNFIEDFEFTWGGSYAQSISKSPFDYYMNYKEPIGLKDSTGRATSGMNLPDDFHISENPERLIPYAVNNFKVAIMDSGIFSTGRNFEKEKTGYSNIVRKYLLGDMFAGEVKLGGKYRAKYRSKESEKYFAPYYLGFAWKPKDLSGTYFNNFYQRYLANNANRVPSMLDFLAATPADRKLYDKYLLNPLMETEAAHKWYDLNVDDHEVDREAELDYYEVNENVVSGYVMNTFKFAQDVIFIAGLRYEEETNSYKSRFLAGTGSLGGFPTPKNIPVKDTTYEYKEHVWLPNFHLSLKPFEFMNLRLAAYRALSRPDYNARLIKFYARGSGTVNTVNVGNSTLRTAKAWNYEVNTSFYDNAFGLISISGFYKKITDDIHVLTNAAFKGRGFLDSLGVKLNAGLNSLTNGNYLLIVPYNAQTPSSVWGFEFEHQANLNFLPGYLRNIILSYNFSLIKSEAYYLSTKTVFDTLKVDGEFGPVITLFPRTVLYEKKQRFEGQPEFFCNVSLGYEIYDFSSRISMYYQGEYNSSFSANSESDGVRGKFTKVDVALKYKILPNVSLLMNLNNILDISEDQFSLNRNAGWRFPVSSERFGPTYDFGVRVDL